MQSKTQEPKPPPLQQTINISLNPQEFANQNKPENNIEKLKEIQDLRKTKLISLYVVGGMLSPLHPNFVPILFEILEAGGKCEKIDLILRSTGGFAEVPWRIVSLIREYCDTFAVIVPEIALSGATHIAIAADELVLSEGSTLGSVDPTRNHPLLPQDKNQNPIPISVQDLKHCILFIKEQLGVKKEVAMEEIIIAELFKHIHPLSIGAIEQSYQLSKLITRKVLGTRKKKLTQEHVDKIEKILGGEYFSHSFPICREDVKNDLELPVTKASPKLKEKMWDLHLYYMKEFNKSKSITQKNQPPFQFKYVGFLDTIYTRRALCAIIDPNNKPILASWVTI